MIAVAVVSAAPTSSPPPSPWDPLHTLLSRWPYTDNFLVQVGNASGIQFEYSRGNMTPDAHVLTASTSKWPSAMALAGVVADGSIKSLDSKVNDYVPWWSTNVSDPRSNVTLRHLLSFTSGFGNGMPGNESYKGMPCMRWQGNITYEECAKEVHDKVEIWCSPGQCYSYNGNHLKLAGVMAMHATGLSIQGVLDKYMTKGLRMSSTACSYTPKGATHVELEPNPDLSVCLNTTGHDYGSFLSGLLNRDILSKEVIDASEQDYTPGDMMGDGYVLYGHYGFGHFLECFDSYQGFTKECAAAKVHCDPGAFGFCSYRRARTRLPCCVGAQVNVFESHAVRPSARPSVWLLGNHRRLRAWRQLPAQRHPRVPSRAHQAVHRPHRPGQEHLLEPRHAQVALHGRTRLCQRLLLSPGALQVRGERGDQHVHGVQQAKGCVAACLTLGVVARLRRGAGPERRRGRARACTSEEGHAVDVLIRVAFLLPYCQK